MSDTLGPDSGSGPPASTGAAPPGGGPPGGPSAGVGAPGGMPGGPPAGFPRPGMRPSVPGAGTRAGGLMKLINAIKMLQLALADLPIGSDAHIAALKASQDLSKHVNMGPETEGPSHTGVSQLLQMLAKSAMAGRAQAPGAQGAPAMPPTTPLPGA